MKKHTLHHHNNSCMQWYCCVMGCGGDLLWPLTWKECGVSAVNMCLWSAGPCTGEDLSRLRKLRADGAAAKGAFCQPRACWPRPISPQHPCAWFTVAGASLHYSSRWCLFPFAAHHAFGRQSCGDVAVRELAGHSDGTDLRWRQEAASDGDAVAL